MSEHPHYETIAKAIDYIQDNFRKQPSLTQIAEAVHLSPAHFQRIFTEWAGISPKKFLQYVSLEHAKLILKQSEENHIFDATFATGLSSTSRLHDLFVNIEGMSPAEYRHGGQNLTIDYQFAGTLFGNVLIASTAKGICHIAFIDTFMNTSIENEIPAFDVLKEKFPNALFLERASHHHDPALTLLQKMPEELPEIKLHLKGTDFQLKVWESLLKIPAGALTTYSSIAKEIGSEKASRAVGSAIGKNPVAFLIPCHRVIRTSGELGGYMWGLTRKRAIIGWENAQVYSDLSETVLDAVSEE